MSAQTVELLSLFKIEHKKNELALNLPYGEQRKLEIARALASNPSLLLLDEPAAGMNPQETEELMKIISFIKDEFRLTILLIEHDMRLVMGICKRLLVLDYGRIIAAGTPDEIRRDPAVIKAYLGTEAVNG
jgi:branched-chain amino acid transport system ATP-binding protein